MCNSHVGKPKEVINLVVFVFIRFHLKKCPEELDISKNHPLGGDSSSEILNESEEPLPPPLPSLDELCRKRKVLLKYRFYLRMLFHLQLSFSVVTKVSLLRVSQDLKNCQSHLLMKQAQRGRCVQSILSTIVVSFTVYCYPLAC